MQEDDAAKGVAEREHALEERERVLESRVSVATARELALARAAAALTARERRVAATEEALAAREAEVEKGREQLESLRGELEERERHLSAPPKIVLVPPDGPLRERVEFRVDLENVDRPVALQVASLGSHEWRAAPGQGLTLDTSELDDGGHLVRAAGDGVASEPVEILVDNAPPRVRVLAPAWGAVVSGSVRIEADAEDAFSGVRSLSAERSRDAERWRPILERTWDTTRDEDGEWLVRAVAVDKAGNTGTSEAVRVAVRNPVVTNGLTGPGGVAPSPTLKLADLEQAVAERTDLDPYRVEELRALLYHLRDFADVDGKIPPEFDALIAVEFGPLL